MNSFHSIANPLSQNLSDAFASGLSSAGRFGGRMIHHVSDLPKAMRADQSVALGTFILVNIVCFPVTNLIAKTFENRIYNLGHKHDLTPSQQKVAGFLVNGLAAGGGALAVTYTFARLMHYDLSRLALAAAAVFGVALRLFFTKCQQRCCEAKKAAQTNPPAQNVNAPAKTSETVETSPKEQDKSVKAADTAAPKQDAEKKSEAGDKVPALVDKASKKSEEKAPEAKSENDKTKEGDTSTKSDNNDAPSASSDKSATDDTAQPTPPPASETTPADATSAPAPTADPATKVADPSANTPAPAAPDSAKGSADAAPDNVPHIAGTPAPAQPLSLTQAQAWTTMSDAIKNIPQLGDADKKLLDALNADVGLPLEASRRPFKCDALDTFRAKEELYSQAVDKFRDTVNANEKTDTTEVDAQIESILKVGLEAYQAAKATIDVFKSQSTATKVADV